jgi:hypothetical protein
MCCFASNFDIFVGFYHDNAGKASRQKKQVIKVKAGTGQ